MKKNKNKKLPLVSIILNCHNAEKFLKKSISSVIKQKYINWELIIFDNCSNDNTKIEVFKFRKNKKVKYFRSNKLYNLYNARNLAIKKAKGSLITFLDADDWWSKDKLDMQVKFLEKNKDINIVYSNLFVFNEKKNKTSLFSKVKLYNGKITQLLLNDFKMPILTTMIRKKIFLKYSFDKNYSIIGDFDLFLRLSLKEKIFSIQEPLATYRIHDSNMTTRKINLNIKELENWLYKNCKKKYFKNYNFLNVKKTLQTLKIKENFINGNIINALKEIFKNPFNIYNVKYIIFLILQKILSIKFDQMNKNLLDRLVKKGSSNLLVKPIFNNENDRLTLQNFLNNQNFLNPNDVLEILTINFKIEQPIGYTLINDKKEIVGFLGTIFSSIPVEEKFIEHCYLHSWIVLKKYRLEAFKLILPLIKKNIFLSTYSPIKSLEGLYKKLSFEEHHFFSKFVFFLPLSKFNNSQIKYSEDVNFFEKYLKEKDKIFLKDHAHTNTKKFFIYFNENLHDNILFILKKRTKKIIISILDIIYISDFEKFSLHEKIICVEFLKKFKTIIFKFSDIGANKICSNNSIFSKIVKKNVYYLNKPKNFKFNILYSELVI